MQQCDRLKTHYCVISVLTLFIVIEAYRPVNNKKLSYRRETARQLPTWREGRARPSSPLPSAPSGYTYAYG